jgi:hypothetical protein
MILREGSAAQAGRTAGPAFYPLGNPAPNVDTAAAGGGFGGANDAIIAGRAKLLLS